MRSRCDLGAISVRSRATYRRFGRRECDRNVIWSGNKLMSVMRGVGERRLRGMYHDGKPLTRRTPKKNSVPSRGPQRAQTKQLVFTRRFLWPRWCSPSRPPGAPCAERRSMAHLHCCGRVACLHAVTACIGPEVRLDPHGHSNARLPTSATVANLGEMTFIRRARRIPPAPT